MSFLERIIERISYEDEASMRTKTAFVLSGGGNKGIAQIGMLRALQEKGITPDVLIGSSVGALNAAGYSVEPNHEGIDHIQKIWLEVVPHNIFQGNKLTRALNIMKRGGYLFDNAGLKIIIEEALKRTGARNFDDLHLPVRVVTCNYHTGQEIVFNNGPIAPALLASAALPGVFPLVDHYGLTLVDGGVVDSVPLWHAFEKTIKTIYILDTSSSNREVEPKSPLDVILKCFKISRNQRFESELENSFTHYGVTVMQFPKIEDRRELEDFGNGEAIIDQAYVKAQDFLS